MEFTKEHLISAANARMEFAEMMMAKDLLSLQIRNWSIEAELARIALASLEAEPVAWIVHARTGDQLTADGGYVANAEGILGLHSTPLYTAPPAPVSVPDESAVELLATDLMKRIDKITGERHSIATLSSLRVSIVEACRAAMLQNGNPPAQSDCCPAQKCISPAQDGNSPAIPDGWVACSERMPDIGTEIFYFCQDDGLRDCGIVSSSNFSDKGDAQLYVHGEGYDLRFGVDISHWMPLPASPQQEVK